MIDDKQALIDLNIQINDAENLGDAGWLSAILAPKLAFLRADEKKTVEDQVTYIQKVRPAEPGQERVIRRDMPVHLYGDRAVVECTIGIGEKEFHNLRVFIRRDGGWKLLAWANEELSTAAKK